MSAEHVTVASHPDLSEDQRAEVNEAVSKWCFGNEDNVWVGIMNPISSAEYSNAVERIVAEVTA